MQQWLLYIDPGSGSYLIQVIIAAALGAAFWIKTSWHRIRHFFNRDKTNPEENKTEEK